MPCHKYLFAKQTPMSGVESSLILAIWSCESLHGEARVQMDALYEFDPKRRHLVIDSSTEVGLDLNKLLTGLLRREYGNDHFAVVRQAEACLTATGAAP